jgi:hypothetical protein
MMTLVADEVEDGVAHDLPRCDRDEREVSGAGRPIDLARAPGLDRLACRCTGNVLFSLDEDSVHLLVDVGAFPARKNRDPLWRRRLGRSLHQDKADRLLAADLREPPPLEERT